MTVRRFVLSSNEIRLLEQRLIKAGFSELAMMESVASNIAHRLHGCLKEVSSIVLLAGPGNNGADGCAVLRLLMNMGWSGPTAVVLWPGKKSSARETQERLLRLIPKSTIEFFDLSPSLFSKLKRRALVLDAVFGTGFRERDPMPEVVDFLLAFGTWVRKTKSVVVAIDVPSGLEDSGHMAAEFHPLRADVSFCVSGPRLSQLEPEGAEQSGRIECVDLGLAPVSGSITWVGRRLSEITQVVSDLDFDVRRFTRGAHKNSRGRVAVVGGSLTQGAATRLAAQTALRFGAGYATLFESTPFKGQARELIKRAGEWVIRSWPQSAEAWQTALGSHDVMVFGCGLPAGGLGKEDEAMWAPFFKAFQNVLAAKTKCRAVVVDGGGLVSFLKFAGSKTKVDIPLIFTPHPKEAADMLGALGIQIPEGRVELYHQLRKALAARGWRGALLLKGAYPLLGAIESDTELFALNVASPRLATAGSGDTLAGAVAGAALRIQDARVALLAACVTQMRAVKRLRTGALASEIGAAMGECWQEEIQNVFRV